MSIDIVLLSCIYTAWDKSLILLLPPVTSTSPLSSLDPTPAVRLVEVDMALLIHSLSCSHSLTARRAPLRALSDH